MNYNETSQIPLYQQYILNNKANKTSNHLSFFIQQRNFNSKLNFMDSNISNIKRNNVKDHSEHLLSVPNLNKKKITLKKKILENNKNNFLNSICSTSKKNNKKVLQTNIQTEQRENLKLYLSINDKNIINTTKKKKSEYCQSFPLNYTQQPNEKKISLHNSVMPKKISIDCLSEEENNYPGKQNKRNKITFIEDYINKIMKNKNKIKERQNKQKQLELLLNNSGKKKALFYDMVPYLLSKLKMNERNKFVDRLLLQYEKNKDNKILKYSKKNEINKHLIVNYIFLKELLNNVRREIKVVDKKTELEKLILALTDEEIYQILSKDIKNKNLEKINKKDFKTVGFEYLPEILKYQNLIRFGNESKIVEIQKKKISTEQDKKIETEKQDIEMEELFGFKIKGGGLHDTVRNLLITKKHPSNKRAFKPITFDSTNGKIEHFDDCSPINTKENAVTLKTKTVNASELYQGGINYKNNLDKEKMNSTYCGSDNFDSDNYANKKKKLNAKNYINAFYEARKNSFKKWKSRKKAKSKSVLIPENAQNSLLNFNNKLDIIAEYSKIEKIFEFDKSSKNLNIKKHEHENPKKLRNSLNIVNISPNQDIQNTNDQYNMPRRNSLHLLKKKEPRTNIDDENDLFIDSRYSVNLENDKIKKNNYSKEKKSTNQQLKFKKKLTLESIDSSYNFSASSDDEKTKNNEENESSENSSIENKKNINNIKPSINNYYENNQKSFQKKNLLFKKASTFEFPEQTTTPNYYYYSTNFNTTDLNTNNNINTTPKIPYVPRPFTKFNNNIKKNKKKKGSWVDADDEKVLEFMRHYTVSDNNIGSLKEKEAEIKYLTKFLKNNSIDENGYQKVPCDENDVDAVKTVNIFGLNFTIKTKKEGKVRNLFKEFMEKGKIREKDEFQQNLFYQQLLKALKDLENSPAMRIKRIKNKKFNGEPLDDFSFDENEKIIKKKKKKIFNDIDEDISLIEHLNNEPIPRRSSILNELNNENPEKIKFIINENDTIQDIEKKKFDLLAKLKTDIRRKIALGAMSLNEMENFERFQERLDILREKMKIWEKVKNIKKTTIYYAEKIQDFFGSFTDELGLIEQKRLEEERINGFIKNLHNQIDMVKFKKNMQIKKYCKPVNYDSINHVNLLNKI